MKKASLFVVTVSILLATSPVSALEILIDSSGKTTFYNDGVLGDTTEEQELEEFEGRSQEMNERHNDEVRAQNERQASEREQELLKKKQEAEKKQLQKEVEQKRTKQLEQRAKEKNETKIKSISPQAEKELKLKQENGKTKIELKEKQKTGGRESVEELETERVRLDLPASVEREMVDEFNDQVQAINSEARELRKQEGADKQMIQQVRHERVKQVIEERKQRLTERVEIQQAENSLDNALELRSREVAAEIDDTHELTVDPETNELGLQTENGEVISINHLPDQAKARLKELGKLDEIEDSTTQHFVLTTTPEGKVVYRLVAPKKYKFLGLFDRKIETEITLDDSTGEAEEERVESSGFSAFLDALTF